MAKISAEAWQREGRETDASAEALEIDTRDGVLSIELDVGRELKGYGVRVNIPVEQLADLLPKLIKEGLRRKWRSGYDEGFEAAEEEFKEQSSELPDPEPSLRE